MTVEPTRRGIRSAQAGLLVNTVLALVKLVAGLIGNSYALVADAVESTADIVGSLVVWGGLRVAGRGPDEEYPYGYGKAESLAAAVVAVMLLGAALGIGAKAAQGLSEPQQAPAPWTLAVLVLVVAVKFALSRWVRAVGVDIGSAAVQTDAWHHLSDAITSAAAFVGIAVAVLGGPGWESADEWAALVAGCVIAWNGQSLLRPALADLMDRTPGGDVVGEVRRAAERVPRVLAVEKLLVRRSGLNYHVAIHVHADPAMPLAEAHALGGRVKAEIRAAVPRVDHVLVHMEPFEAQPARVGSP